MKINYFLNWAFLKGPNPQKAMIYSSMPQPVAQMVETDSYRCGILKYVATFCDFDPWRETPNAENNSLKQTASVIIMDLYIPRL